MLILDRKDFRGVIHEFLFAMILIYIMILSKNKSYIKLNIFLFNLYLTLLVIFEVIFTFVAIGVQPMISWIALILTYKTIKYVYQFESKEKGDDNK